MTELEYYLVRQKERNIEMLSELEGVFEHLIFKEKAADERADEAEKRADEADERADEAEKRADEADERADEAEKRADEAEKRADEADERADEADERADEAEERVRELLEDNAQGAAYIEFLKKRIQELGGGE